MMLKILAWATLSAIRRDLWLLAAASGSALGSWRPTSSNRKIKINSEASISLGSRPRRSPAHIRGLLHGGATRILIYTA